MIKMDGGISGVLGSFSKYFLGSSTIFRKSCESGAMKFMHPKYSPNTHSTNREDKKHRTLINYRQAQFLSDLGLSINNAKFL
jgi:hypothetical protein